MAVAPEEKIRFGDAGPEGPARFEAGVAGYEARAFRGLGVFTSTPYEVSDDTDSVQMLQRSTQVGEFYRMQAPKVFDTEKKLPPHYMDVVIYDEEMDKHVHITVKEALTFALGTKNDGVTPGTIGDLGTAPSGAGAGAAASTPLRTALSNTESATDVVASLKDSYTKGTATAVIAETEDAASITASIASGNWLPLEIIIARPFIEHLMMSAIICVAGRDTGATLFGPADMQISANTSVKTIEGHYT